ncbi:amidohydrolase family protein [Caulobacter sp. 602-2]|uniref:Amidohydrolase family protein n=1 Tax=Caulobacter sp. 602-2 TaxID=2710887 RepID=A0A6G4QZ43_9CAUL|nr:CIA30 family protein [Caulobacter sp. 602-2]NGM50802.1 amidohydrolase family protein [Caulobacter sp. 602-2]
MNRARILLGGLCAAALSTSLAAAQPLAVVNAEIFDATGAAPYRGTLVVENGRILAVGPKVKAPKGATIVDAKGEALIPGLFDVHTHWTPNGAPAVIPKIADAYVASGVTTVNDFHQQPESFAPRRAWLGTLTAPHVNFVARISTPGGHGADWADQATTRWVDTPEGARAAVETIAAYKPDAIKAFTDGWRYGSAPDNTSMDAWTLKALTETAHKHGLKVLTHTVTVEQGKVAATSGVDVIAHSLQDEPLDAETIASIKASGLFYAPTLAVYEPVKPGAKPPADPDSPRARQSRLKFGYALSNAKALYDAGVPLALGTDAGMTGTPHGSSTLRELELLVKAGLTPAQALTVGTAGSAKAMNMLADRGTLEAGKRADFVLVAGKPWETISDARKVERVFIDGKPSFGPGAKRSAANDKLTPPAVKAGALIDDFERADGRTSLDTLRLDDFDGGRDRSLEVSQVIEREGGGKVLSVGARMATKDDASAGILLPLTRGSVVPADASAFKGLKLSVRGDGGAYVVSLVGAAGRWTAKVDAGSQWRTIELPFSAFKPAGREKAAFTGTDLLQVGVEGERPAGAKLWFELDDVTFY